MEIIKFFNQKEIVQINKGKILYNEGEKCQSIIFILEGQIKISSFLKDGKEIIYQILNKDDMFGNNLIFLDDFHYKGSIIATKDSKIIALSKDEYLNLIQNNLDFLKYILKENALKSSNLNINLKMALLKSPMDKLEYLFKLNNNEIHYKNVSELASFLYLSREATSRLIHQLERKKMITIQNKTIKKDN